jgi:hypothetical protein
MKPLTIDQNENVRTLDSKSSNASVRRDDNAGLVGGTVTAICHHILSDTETEMNKDCRIFCNTVGFWAPVEVVLLEMTRISSKEDVASRLEMIIRFWCDHTPRLLWEEGAKEVLLSLVEEGVTRIDATKGRVLAEYVIQTERKFKALLHPDEEAVNDHDSVQRMASTILLMTVNVEESGLQELGLTGNVLLQIPPEAISEQLFLFHLKYLLAVDPAADMSLLLDRSASQRSRSPLVFSQQSPHFLTRLVYTHVLALDAPDATYDLGLRAQFLTRWIQIGKAMKARGDLAGFLAIASALLSVPILRLKETWTDVDVELRSMVCREWSPMMKELHRRELGADGGSWTAHVLTPDLKREELDSHLVIPYYGDICTALEMFDIWAV